MKNAKVKKHWYGIRSKPINRPAPLLENLEDGLIIASGFYRNGILLIPSTAEWIAEQLNNS